MATSLAALCRAEVRRRVEATVAEVVAAVGRTIPAGVATAAGRAVILRKSRQRIPTNPDNPVYTPHRLARIGRLEIVARALRYEVRAGRLRRVAAGRYAAEEVPR